MPRAKPEQFKVGRRGFTEQEHVTSLMQRQPGFRRVYDYAHTGDAELISRDGQETLVMATFKTRRLAYEAADGCDASSRGQHVSFGGLDIVFEELTHRSRMDLALAELFALPLLLLLSLWVFRGLVAALMPLIVGAFTILGTFLGLRIVDEFLGISVFALNLVSALGLGLAIDYTLFVLSRYREESRRPRSGRDRAHARQRRTHRALQLANGGRAMASLCVFPLRFLYSMGIGGALHRADRRRGLADRAAGGFDRAGAADRRARAIVAHAAEPSSSRGSGERRLLVAPGAVGDAPSREQSRWPRPRCCSRSPPPSSSSG